MENGLSIFAWQWKKESVKPQVMICWKDPESGEWMVWILYCQWAGALVCVPTGWVPGRNSKYVPSKNNDNDDPTQVNPTWGEFFFYFAGWRIAIFLKLFIQLLPATPLSPHSTNQLRVMQVTQATAIVDAHMFESSVYPAGAWFMDLQFDLWNLWDPLVQN